MSLNLSTIELRTYNQSVNSEIRAALMTVAPDDPAGTRMLDCLTLREREVLGCVADGMCDKAISAHLGMKYETVKRHLVNVRDKIGMSTRLEIAVAVYRHPALLAAIPIPSLRETQ